MKFSYDKYPMLKELAKPSGRKFKLYGKDSFFTNNRCLVLEPLPKDPSHSVFPYHEKLEYFYQFIRASAIDSVSFATQPVVNVFDNDIDVADKLLALRNNVKSIFAFTIFPSGQQYLYWIENDVEIKSVTVVVFSFINKDHPLSKDIQMKLHMPLSNNMRAVLLNYTRCIWHYDDPYEQLTIDNDFYNISGDTIQNSYDVYTVVTYELFKQYAELETAYVDRDKRPRQKVGKEKFLSKDFPYKIDIITSNWFTEIVRSKGFSVRGHFRLQPCGKGREERKLIWINPFEKDGYTLRARKTIQN